MRKIDETGITSTLLHKFSWVPTLIKAITGVLVSIKQGVEFLINVKQRVKGSSKNEKTETSKSSSPSPSPKYDEGLRLIVAGPQRNSCRTLVNILLGHGIETTDWEGDHECIRWRTSLDGREVTMVGTPDLLGKTLESRQRACEALRSLHLASPGPHAFLLALTYPQPNPLDLIGAEDALRSLLMLVGEEALRYVLVVLLVQTESYRSGQGRQRGRVWNQTCSAAPTPTPTLAQILESDSGGLRETLCMCSQRPELVVISPQSEGKSRGAIGEARDEVVSRLLERAVEMRAVQGHYVHELQRREERIRQELLADMTHILAQKLEGNWG